MFDHIQLKLQLFKPTAQEEHKKNKINMTVCCNEEAAAAACLTTVSKNQLRRLIYLFIVRCLIHIEYQGDDCGQIFAFHPVSKN